MPGDRRVTLKSLGQIEKMAVAGRLVSDVLDMLGAELRPGLTTAELDRRPEHVIMVSRDNQTEEETDEDS